MKKRFLPISLLLTIIILAQTSFVVNANGDSGKYNPRTTMQPTAQSFMKSIRANQETGLIDPAWILEATKGSQSKDGELNWASLGPDNYGSLTRGIIYDNQDATNKTLYIGTMGGGIFKSENGGITWKTVSTNLMVSCMVQTENGTIYVGTGDGRGAHNQNGLSDLNYENSFIGDGIYKLEGETLTQIESTSAFVNDLAAYGNKVYAATNEGLKVYENDAWTTLIEGEAYGVDVCANGDYIAVVGYDVYTSTENGPQVITTGEENMLPASETYKIVATAPSDHNYMYVAYLTSSNGTGNIYVTSDHGATWQVAYTATSMYDIFGSRGLLDNAMTVYPNNPRKVLIGGINLWVMRDELNNGIYRLECLSSGSGFQIAQTGGLFYYNYTYIHSGIQNIVFNPKNINEFYVGSEGGIFKGTCSAADGYQFEGMNRYMIDAENHTSVARMFSVGFSGMDNNQALGGSLDHGTIYINGDKSVSEEVQAGSAIFPNDIATTNAAETYGAFDYTKAAGPCAISTINPQAMFVTVTGGYSIGTPLFRTQTAGVDYDKENFSYSATESSAYIENTNAFRTPIALFENYNDTKSVDTVKYFAKEDLNAGDTVMVHSLNGTNEKGSGYPFEYVLTENMVAGDSIEVTDIISSTFIVAVEKKVLMTRDALQFNKVANWWEIASITGIPNALAISADGDVAYVGTLSGDLYRIAGITDAVSEEAVSNVITLDTLDATAFNGQAITSIAIDPQNSDNVIVTLGNYGNTDYVFYSNNGGSSFTAKQGNLPSMPVYSSLIEKTTGKVILGTENGIYSSENMSTWNQDGLSNVPVMDLKQQVIKNHDAKYTHLVDEVGAITTTEYAGISNEGIIYAATYGRGLYKCETYKVDNSGSEVNINKNVANNIELNIYPNPIVSEATISFNIEESAQVTYQVYDLSGRMVMNNVLGNYAQGSHKANLNVEALSAGTYIIKVQAGNVSNTTKVLVY